MDKEQRQQLVDRHRASLARHGYSSKALFWESRGVQKTRFRVLTEIGIRSGDSVLDIGCGFGDLEGFLQGQGLTVGYTGIDLSPEIVDRAVELHPDATILAGELFDFDWPPHAFDWVLLSGTLNWQLHDDGAYARRLIARMFELCRKGVAFNMLDARHPDMKAQAEFVAFDPDAMLAFCRNITAECRCRTDYLDHDFTIYMCRESHAMRQGRC